MSPVLRIRIRFLDLKNVFDTLTLYISPVFRIRIRFLDLKNVFFAQILHISAVFRIRIRFLDLGNEPIQISYPPLAHDYEHITNIAYPDPHCNSEMNYKVPEIS
jgi:hypothetical protein